MSSLSDCVARNDSAALISYLELGANPNSYDQYGYTALNAAVITGNVECFDILINHPNIDVNKKDINGSNPLKWALHYNSFYFCEQLLDKNAILTINSNFEMPALVMPLLRNNKQILEAFVDRKYNLDSSFDYIVQKKISHRFELVGFSFYFDDAFKLYKPVNFEGFLLEFSLEIISNSFYEYSKSNSLNPLLIKYYNIMHDSLRKCVNFRLIKAEYEPKRSKDLKNILGSDFNENLLMLPVAFEGHAVIIIKYKNFLAYCDRGVGSYKDTVKFYYILNNNNFDYNLLYKLLYQGKSRNFMEKELPALLDLKQIDVLPILSQKTGNCSFANTEAALPAMLFILVLAEQDFNIENSSKDLKKNIMNFYSDWVLFDKKRVLQLVLDHIKGIDVNRALPIVQSLVIVLYQSYCLMDIIDEKDLYMTNKILHFLHSNKDYEDILDKVLGLLKNNTSIEYENLQRMVDYYKLNI